MMSSMLTRRSALALPAALSLVGLGEPETHPWLSCFFPDKIPVGADAVYDADLDQQVFVLGSSEGYKTADNIYSPKDTAEGVRVPSIVDTDAALESAAGAMLSSAAEYTKHDARHRHRRYVRDPRDVAGRRLSVDEPFWVGRLCLFSDGSRGLLLFNPAAVVEV